MSDNWQASYEELKAFISRNESIEIGKSITYIPSDVRQEFYQLFDMVRQRIVREGFLSYLDKGSAMSKRWSEASLVLMETFGLEPIEMDADVGWFLRDPIDGLTRLLFEPLFDLLKAKKDLVEFEKSVSEAIEGGYRKYMYEGYKAWVTMELLKLMSTEKVFHVPPSEFDQDPSSLIEMAQQGAEENTPDAVETKNISFKHSLKCSFLVPNIIVYSRRIESFAAFVPDFDYNESHWRARDLSLNRKWNDISEIIGEFGRGKLWPDMAVYVGVDWKDLVVAADFARVGQPDLILEFRTEKDWYEKEGLELIRRHYNVLKPILGSYVVCLEPVPDAAMQDLENARELKAVEQGETGETSAGELSQMPTMAEAVSEIAERPDAGIHLLNVGYDANNMEPVVEALMQGQAMRSGDSQIERPIA